MGTESVFGYTDIQGTKSTKVAHKMHLVTPRMDVDVTGVSFKPIRTTVIDHPRDEGQRHREQLWNYQQRYRGAIGKLKSIATNSAGGSNGVDPNVADPEDYREEDNNYNNNNNNVRSSSNRASAEKSSLQSRFRKRLSNKLKIASLRHSEIYLDSATRSQPQTERRESDKMATPSGIQRLYSSGLIVKNSLYKQIRHGDTGDGRQSGYPDNSRILETIEKFGSLEKLPDISFTHSDAPVHYSLQTLKSLSSYSRRFIEQQTSQERRITPLQRAQTITDTSRPSMKKIFIRKRGNHTARLLRMNCIDSANDDDDDDDEEEDDDDDDDDEDDDADDEHDVDYDYYDECDNEPGIIGGVKLRTRDCDKKRPDHIAIRSNVTNVNTQDDLALIQSKNSPRDGMNTSIRKEQTFHVHNSNSHIVASSTIAHQKQLKRVYRDFVTSATVNNAKGKQQLNDQPQPNDQQQTTGSNIADNQHQSNNETLDTKQLTTSTNKDGTSKGHTPSTKTETSNIKEDTNISKGRQGRRSSIKCSSRKEIRDYKNDKVNNTVTQGKETTEDKVQDESDDSIDIPKDRVGHTTHSIERKLSIRKPWEWKPSPFRWIDKPYVRESDKPYIERVLNRGEIIDEFNYDSYARTKPLKVQNYPEHAGYKDRYGVMR